MQNINTNTNTPTNINSLDVLVPLEFKPKPINYKGTFISKTWDIQEKEGKTTVKDLLIKVKLEDEKNELDQQVVIERRYNMLPRARGVSDFKKDMASYLGYKLDDKNNGFPAKLLANQSLIQLDGKPVIVAYKSGRGVNGTHDRFLPVETVPATPVETAPAAPIATA